MEIALLIICVGSLILMGLSYHILTVLTGYIADLRQQDIGQLRVDIAQLKDSLKTVKSESDQSWMGMLRPKSK